MTNAERQKIQRNTGAYIDIVFDKSPAFYANIMPGDIVIEINGVEIIDKTLIYAMSLLLEEDSIVNIKYLRNGQEYEKSFLVH